MAKATWSQHNFNGGEWSPLMYGRTNLDKYKTALAECVNFVPTVQGGLVRRSGTRFVAEVKDSSKAVLLVRFEFSTTQAYALEFGDLYVRFCANHGQVLNASATAPLEVVTPYTAAELSELSFEQSADVLYIFHKNHPPAKLERLGATNWVYAQCALLDGPYLPINTTSTTITPSALGTGSITLTASSTTGINAGAGFGASDVGRHIRLKIGVGWGWGIISAVTSATVVTATIAEAIGGIQATATASYASGKLTAINVTNQGKGYDVAPIVTISGGGGSGGAASGGVVLDEGKVIAIALSAVGSGYDSTPTVAITPPPGVTAMATTMWRLGIWGTRHGYPVSGGFHEDRLYYAGCKSFPQRIDGSNVSDYENMQPSAYNSVVVDSNAVGFLLNASDVNAINWVCSDERGLLIGTSGAEWLLKATAFGYPITPTNYQARPSSTYGSSKVKPAKVGRHTLFVQRNGRCIRELGYVFQVDGFQALNVGAIAGHVLAEGVVQMAVQKTPQQIVWIVAADGTLVGFTYEKEQEVLGYHRHILGGAFSGGNAVVESAVCIPSPDGTADELWLLVKRTINGVQKRYIEYMTPLWVSGTAPEDAVYVDCSAEYNGSAVTHISGLSWLTGEEVTVLTDGATHPNVTVSAGAIDLAHTASVVQVGLGYSSYGKTLPLEAGGADGTAQGKLKRIHRAAARLHETVGFKIGPSHDNLTTIPFRTSYDAMNTAVPLFTGDLAWLSFDGTYERQASVCWAQDLPLPCNILLLVAQVETQDAG